MEAIERKAFASALDFPGWSRSGRTEGEALAALEAYRDRYAAVAARASTRIPARFSLEVVERVPGDATTGFGAPGQVSEHERRPLDAARARRLSALLAAAWESLAAIAGTAPEELTKGPRGGGRDRTQMIAHVVDAEYAYARKIGIRASPSTVTGEALRAQVREAIESAVGPVPEDWKWPPAYFVRRCAWHALDHAWEMEDRIPT